MCEEGGAEEGIRGPVNEDEGAVRGVRFDVLRSVPVGGGEGDVDTAGERDGHFSFEAGGKGEGRDVRS